MVAVDKTSVQWAKISPADLDAQVRASLVPGAKTALPTSIDGYIGAIADTTRALLGDASAAKRGGLPPGAGAATRDALTIALQAGAAAAMVHSEAIVTQFEHLTSSDFEGMLALQRELATYQSLLATVSNGGKALFDAQRDDAAIIRNIR